MLGFLYEQSSGQVGQVPCVRPSNLTAAQKRAFAAEWDRSDPSWLSVRRSISAGFFSSTTRTSVTVRCPVERNFIRSYQAASAIRRSDILVWAVDQVLLFGCGCEDQGVTRVETGCPSGAVRWKDSATGIDSCYSCVAPLVLYREPNGRPFCARPLTRFSATILPPKRKPTPGVDY